jgi:hypothetical protein
MVGIGPSFPNLLEDHGTSLVECSATREIARVGHPGALTGGIRDSAAVFVICLGISRP